MTYILYLYINYRYITAIQDGHVSFPGLPYIRSVARLAASSLRPAPGPRPPVLSPLLPLKVKGSGSGLPAGRTSSRLVSS